MVKKWTYDEAYELLKPYKSDFFMSIMLAQFNLESVMGTSGLAVKANNFTGHKTTGWNGEVYKKDTIEDDGKGNKFVAKSEPFRKYKTPSEWAKHHASWLQRLPKVYNKAINAKTVEEQAKALQGTYATDTAYAKKLLDIIERDGLKKYDKKKGNDTMAKLTLEQAFAKLGLPFKKQLLPLTKTYGRVNRKEGIVIHQTGAPSAGSNAQAMANYQANMAKAGNREEKSWNYQVDDKQAIMSFDHNVATWQASDGNGPGNMAHISIESCINSDGNYAKGIDNLAKLMAVIAYIEGFNIERQTRRHYDFARDKKWCPAQIMNGKEGFTYAKVKQMAQAHLNTLDGAKAEPVDVHNPQNLTESKPLDYKAPRLPFETLKSGDKATLLDDKNANGDYIWLWYNPTNNTLLKSKRQEELAGTTDTIKDVKKIDKIQHSQYAYLLKDANSWILEEYLEEPRKNWEVVEVEDEDKVEDGKEVEPLKDGQFWWNDVKYQIREVK